MVLWKGMGILVYEIVGTGTRVIRPDMTKNGWRGR